MMQSTSTIKPRLTPEGKFALLLIACELLTFVPFLVFNKPEIGLGTCISLGMVLIAIRATWLLHKYLWYWPTILFALAIQAPFVALFPWSNRAYRGSALFFLGFLEFIFIWGVIKLAAKVFNRNKESLK